MSGTCYIFAAGDFSGGINVNENDFVIAADAGLLYARQQGINPNIVLGDFDSLGNVPSDCDNILTFKPEKDYTDTGIAVQEAISMGYKRIVVCGALGGKRLEHTLANIQTAADAAKRGCDVYLTDGNTVINFLCNGKKMFDEKNRGYVSILSISDTSYGVTLNGFKYLLDDYDLTNTMPLGVSNEFVPGVTGKVQVRDGLIAIIYNVNNFFS